MPPNIERQNLQVVVSDINEKLSELQKDKSLSSAAVTDIIEAEGFFMNAEITPDLFPGPPRVAVYKKGELVGYYDVESVCFHLYDEV